MLELPAHPSSVRQARTFVHKQCRTFGISDEARETAVLLTSEVVTNAFLHGRSGARVALTTTPGRLLVEVGDDNSRLPRMVAQSPEALDGRGLTIVDMLASDWGAREDDGGKVVWFELVHAAQP